MINETRMQAETREAPERIAEQLSANAAANEMLGEYLRTKNPPFIMMVGRGSSDHAGVFAKYLIETELAIPVIAAAPSVASVYGKRLQLQNAVLIAISQSGSSPDILTQVELAKQTGAFCIAMVNDEKSPLSRLADAVLPLYAGEETAVAATKSYLASLSAILQLVAQWAENTHLWDAITRLPEALQYALGAPAQITAETLSGMQQCAVIGRGFGYAIAREVALKLKEVCGIQAEAFSSAEFQHGPIALIERKLPVIDISIQDESLLTHRRQLEDLKKRGANLVHLRQTTNDLHPRLAPLTLMQRFYLDVAEAALSRGYNPDAPPGLQKITRTL